MGDDGRGGRGPRASVGVVAAASALALAAALALAEVLLNPPTDELLLLALFLVVSGALSLAIGLLAARFGPRLGGGIRRRIALAIAVGIGVALANVAITAYLMFLSPHDLALLSLLLLFALLVSLAFGFALATHVTDSLRELATGARAMAAGDLSVRLPARSPDEVGDLAMALNHLAEQTDAAFRRQRELEGARRDLIAAVSHDLRTPLAALQAMTEALSDGVVSDPETVARYLRTMRGDIQSLSVLISDLFEVSQLDAGVLRLQIEASPIQDLISDTLESLQLQARQRGLHLTGSVTADLPPVLMDPTRVQRILYNLVQNAIRHTPADGSVLLRADDAGAEVRVTVVDTGEGIAAADLPRVFDRFYRGDRARSREAGGAGLGLTIARGLVEAHGGRIWAASTVGQGTTFSFTLPKAGTPAPSSGA